MQTPKRRTLILFLITCASVLSAGARANLVTPVDVADVAAKLAAYRFAPAAGISAGEVDVVSEEEFLTHAVDLSAGGLSMRVSSTDYSKIGDIHDSDCLMSSRGNEIQCSSPTIEADPLGSSAVRCTQNFITLNMTEDAAQISVQSLQRTWLARTGQSCSDAEKAGARIESDQVRNAVGHLK